MQFKADSADEYLNTINSIIKANIYNENAMIYALDIVDTIIMNEPKKYPCIVSLELEEFESDNRRYAFNACKFIYIEDLLQGNTYINKINELAELDKELNILIDERDTSGLGFPTEEIAKLEGLIFSIEKQLF